jgi:F-type H+-transporting ATPase subunit b
MLFIIVNVAILALVLTKILYKPVIKILNDRRERILAEVEDAEKSKAEAYQLKTKYEEIMKGVEQEKYDILETARKLAAEISKEQLAEAQDEANALRARAHKEIEMEQERAKSEMKQAVIDVSSVMAAKFLSRSIDADTHEQLFNETMAELEEIAWHN